MRVKNKGQPSVSFSRGIVQALIISVFLVGTGPVWAADISKNFRLSGYGNVHSMDHGGLPRLVGKDNPNDLFFQLREFSLFFDFDITDGVTTSLELESGLNASKLFINYGYVDIDLPTFMPFWNSDVLGGSSVRLGRLLVPFLSYNENKVNFKQFLMSQPFTAWNLIPVIPSPPDFGGLGWSDTGLMVNWYREMGELGLLDLKFSLIEGLGSDSNVLDDNTVKLAAGTEPTIRPRDGLIQNEQNDARDNNHSKATVAKLTYVSPAFPLDLGVSWYRGAWNPSGTKDLQMWGAHARWLARNWTLKGEWVHADVEQDAGINPVTAPGPAAINTSTGDYNMVAWYVEGSVIPVRWGPREDRYLRLVFRYDDVVTNDKISFTPFDKKRITPGMELQFAHNTRFRYEWQYNTLEDFEKAPAPFVAAGGEEHITMHMFSVIFWFE